MSLRIKEEMPAGEASVSAEELWMLGVKEEPLISLDNASAEDAIRNVKVEVIEEESLFAVSCNPSDVEDPLAVTHEAVHQGEGKFLRENVEKVTESEADIHLEGSSSGQKLCKRDAAGSSAEKTAFFRPDCKRKSSGLSRKIWTHAAKKPYSCKMCNNRFSLAFDLKTHMKRHIVLPVKEVDGAEEMWMLKQEPQLSLDNPSTSDEEDISKVVVMDEQSLVSVSSEPSDVDILVSITHEDVHQGEARFHTEKVEMPTEKHVDGSSSGHQYFKSDDAGSSAEKKSFFSRDCKRKSSQSSGLTRQIWKHAAKKRYSCKICDERFSLSFDLKTHVNKHKSQICCVVCKQECSSAYDLETHMKKHVQEKPFTCLVCTEKFSSAYDVKIHMKIHSQDVPFICLICKQKFSSEYNVKAHMKTHSAEEKVNTPLWSQENTEATWSCLLETIYLPIKKEMDEEGDTSVTPEESWMLKELTEEPLLSFNNPSTSAEEGIKVEVMEEDSLVAMLSDVQDPLSVTHEAINQREERLRNMKMEKNMEPFTCLFCQQKFSFDFDFKTHMKTHSDAESFTNLVSQQKFCSADALQTQMKKDEFSCPVCKQNFCSAYDLKTHMKMYRHEKQLFSCQICKKKFSGEQWLKTHMKIHDDEEAYSCPVCKKKLTGAQFLKTHMKIHNEEEAFSCPVCEKKFSEAHHLQFHMTVHKEKEGFDFKCPVCDKQFKTSFGLKIHMKMVH